MELDVIFRYLDLFSCLFSDSSEYNRDYESDPKRVRRDVAAGRSSPPPSAYGDTRRIPLEKLAELERRVGLGDSGPPGGNGYQGGWGRKEAGWY
jgi:hypothetical protein